MKRIACYIMIICIMLGLTACMRVKVSGTGPTTQETVQTLEIIPSIPPSIPETVPEITQPATEPTITSPVTESPHEHQYTVSKTEPSCTKEGKTVYTCQCGDTYTDVIKQRGHNYTVSSIKDATTTSSGYTQYTCTICSVSYKTEIPKKLTAMETDMCGESLLAKPVKHASGAAFAEKALNMIMQGYPSIRAAFDYMVPITEEDGGQEMFQEFQYVYRYMLNETTYTISIGGKYTYFLAWHEGDNFTKTQAVFAEAERILEELKIDNTVTQQEAIRRINDYLCEYKMYNYGEEERNSGTHYSLFNRYGVCSNYAIAFQVLCLGAGIECHYYSSETMNHAWNKVYFSDDTYRWVDVCWNDVQYQFSDGRVVETSVENGVPAKRVEELRSEYLLVTTEQLLKDHTL